MAGTPTDSHGYLLRGLELGEKAGNQKVVGYSCTWLAWTCVDLGRFSEGIQFGKRAQKIARSFPSDQYLFYKSLSALCLINYWKGDMHILSEGVKRLLEYGDRNANSRSKVFGHWLEALRHLSSGDMKAAQENSQKAFEVAQDPCYANFPASSLGLAHLLEGQLQKAEDVLKPALDFCEKRGMGFLSPVYQYYLAPTLIAKGYMEEGMKLMLKAQETLIRNKRIPFYALSEYVLGEIYSQISTGRKPSLLVMAKNIGFLVKNVPFAAKKAEEHFKKSVELFKETDTKGFLGPIYLSLGLLYKAKKRSERARECLFEAINIFQECGAHDYIKRAKEALESLA
jgi:tetratricopeptide (TPR) repeat protein